MLPLLMMVLVIIAGHAIVRLLPLSLTKSERLALATIFGITAATLLGFLLALATTAQIGLYGSIFLLLIVATSHLFLDKRIETVKEPLPKSKIVKLLLYVAWLFIIYYTIALTRTHFLDVYPSGNWYSAGYTWADLALHLSLASHFATQDKIDFVMPVFASGKLTYPFLVNFFSSELYRLGNSWQLAFILPTVAALLSFVRLLLALVFRLTKSLRASWLHLVLVLGSGSVWGMYYLWLEYQRVGSEAFRALDYSNLGENYALPFANLVTSHLLPQRSYLFGVTLCLGLLLVAFHLLEKKSRSLSIALGVGIGCLPFIHTHSTFVMLAVLSCLTIIEKLRKKDVNAFVESLLIALVLALPQLYWQFSASYTSGFSHTLFGWLTPQGTSVWKFWLQNIGAAVFLVPLSLILTKKKNTSSLALTLYLVGGLFFIAGNVYQFQPNDWDNMKFFTYAYIFLMIPVAMLFDTMLRRWYTGVLALLLLVSLTFTGYLAIYRDLNLEYLFLSKADVQFVEKIESSIPKDAIIATSTRHNHPVPLLLGRAIPLGYLGWLWSYGIDVTSYDADMRSFWSGEMNAEEARRKLGVTYAVIGRTEKIESGFNQAYFDANYQTIYATNEWTAYKLIP